MITAIGEENKRKGMSEPSNVVGHEVLDASADHRSKVLSLICIAIHRGFAEFA